MSFKNVMLGGKRRFPKLVVSKIATEIAVVSTR